VDEGTLCKVHKWFKVQAALHERPALACGAGASIKPGVERGFASETPGNWKQINFRAHEMGGSPCAANLVGIFAAFVLSPAFAGLKICRA